jgi:hypothetical protein
VDTIERQNRCTRFRPVARAKHGIPSRRCARKEAACGRGYGVSVNIGDDSGRNIIGIVHDGIDVACSLKIAVTAREVGSVESETSGKAGGLGRVNRSKRLVC